MRSLSLAKARNHKGGGWSYGPGAAAIGQHGSPLQRLLQRRRYGEETGQQERRLWTGGMDRLGGLATPGCINLLHHSRSAKELGKRREGRDNSLRRESPVGGVTWNQLGLGGLSLTPLSPVPSVQGRLSSPVVSLHPTRRCIRMEESCPGGTELADLLSTDWPSEDQQSLPTAPLLLLSAVISSVRQRALRPWRGV